MEALNRTNIKTILQEENTTKELLVMAWVRTKRQSKNVAFLSLNDGSTIANLQIVVDVTEKTEAILNKIHTGASVAVEGILTKSEGGQQSVELISKKLIVLGEANPDKYPLQPKKHSLEFLRENAHLRFRTQLFGAITRIRHAMIFAIHSFFNEKGFYNIHTPLITSSDAEGAGEMFQVTTLSLKNAPKTENNEIDYSQDFFGKHTSLTVSGQLEAELAALALSKVYTFGPTFRAENSNTSRHLAEFWMIEPEIAFADINENIDTAEALLKYCIQYALDNCANDLSFLSQRLINEEKSKPQNQRSTELIEKLHFVVDNDFAVITYTEAFDILRNSKPNKKKKFNYLIDKWGIDFQSEHERYLVEKHFNKPVVIIDYPKEIKAFYMKQNDDGKTVRAMDILFPGIGEIVGGSQREENLDKLIAKMKELNISEEEMSWYLDTRRFGTVPHSGFGLGFERLLLFVTGLTNVRDVIAFPRTPKNCDF